MGNHFLLSILTLNRKAALKNSRSFFLPSLQWKASLLLIILGSALSVSRAQVEGAGQTQLNAIFAASIDLRVEDATVTWAVATIEDYVKGFWPVQRPIPFSVSSSTNWRLDVVNTPMVNGEGVELNIQNLAYRLEPADNMVRDKHGINYNWPIGDGGRVGTRNLSGIYVAGFTPKTILIPGPAGNAGSYAQNAFKIRIGFASPNIRGVTGLPTLLDQNIAPGTYTTILTLTAYSEP